MTKDEAQRRRWTFYEAVKKMRLEPGLMSPPLTKLGACGTKWSACMKVGGGVCSPPSMRDRGLRDLFLTSGESLQRFKVDTAVAQIRARGMEVEVDLA